MSTADADKRLPAATAALQTWRRWCAEHSMSALTAALGFAKSLPARYCVLGVDTLEQFGQIAQAWVSAPTLRFPHLALKDPAIIDPRTWRIER